MVTIKLTVQEYTDLISTLAVARTLFAVTAEDSESASYKTNLNHYAKLAGEAFETFKKAGFDND